MDLFVKNKIISANILDILKAVKNQLSNNKLHDIIDKGENILITCPFHKNGQERKPACQVYANRYGDLPYGSFHCFTCGEKGSIINLIAQCFDKDYNYAENWLVDNFGELTKEQIILEPITIPKFSDKKILDIKTLDKYKYFHEYMFKRKLTEPIIRKFSIGYDAETNCIVFPVWDEHNDLIMLTRRSVNTKYFNIDSNIEKPVYLLNFIKKDNIKTVYIVESQINALTCWVYGYPAVALFGTGTKHQYDILNKSGIDHFILCFDGDEAGNKGTARFIKNIRSDKLIDIKPMLQGKDVNDLTKEEFENLPVINSYDWLKTYK